MNSMKAKSRFFKCGLSILSLILFSTLSMQSNAGGYYFERYIDVEVTVTNITKSIILTPPILAVSHRPKRLFTLGEPASEPLAMVAEGGMTGDLADTLTAQGISVYTWDAGIPPASSSSISLRLKSSDYLHLASMLLPTNDAFIGMNGTSVRRLLRSSKGLKAYDAGTEMNDEICLNIPGPQCGGAGFTAEPGEGIVHPHPGIHGEGDLSVKAYNWGSPVATIRVKLQ